MKCVDCKAEVGEDHSPQECIATLRAQLTVQEVKLTRSPSLEPFHYHAVVTLDLVMDDVQRIALQACLGSDRTRELLSMRRFIKGSDAHPTVFFEKKAD